MEETTQSRQLVLRARIATPSDAPKLAVLAARLFEQTYGAANDPDDIRTYLATWFSTAKQSEELADPHRVAWIAEDHAGEPVGYALLKRGGTAPGVIGTRPAEVQRIYTDTSWHGRGAGALLMNACVEHARQAWQCDVIWLGVWERNPRAVAFYEKHGFHTVGRQTFELGRDVQNDFVMARSL